MFTKKGYPLVICYIAIENHHLIIVDFPSYSRKWWIFPVRYVSLPGVQGKSPFFMGKSTISMAIPSTDLHWFSARLPQLHRFAPQRRSLRAQRLAGAAVRGGLLGEVPGASEQRSTPPALEGKMGGKW